MTRYRKSFASIATAGILTLATTAVVAASEGGAGLPQFDASKFMPQLFWLTVLLLIFFVAIRGNALPKIGGALESRRQKIDDDLDKAAANREEAEAAMAAYEQALADAAAEAQSIHREVAQQIAERSTERRAALAARLAEDTKAAEARIAAAKEPAMASLQDVAAEVVQEAAARLAGLKVSKSDADAAVAATMKERG